jgi:plasmid stabilization system protein ParE
MRFIRMHWLILMKFAHTLHTRIPMPQTGSCLNFFRSSAQLPGFRISVISGPDLTFRPLRFRIVREYLVAYAAEEDPVWILAVIHGRRNPRIMAAVLRDRA